MPLSSLTSRDAVSQAVAEFDEIGRDGFLRKYGFGRSIAYFALIDGKRYDAKALVGAAHGFQYPEQGPLTARDFSGGEDTVQRKLEELGIAVVVDPKVGQIRKRFKRLTAGTLPDGKPAPHKALLALVALRHLSEGGSRLIAPSELARELDAILRRALPGVQNPSPWEPIWRLEHDVWEVVGSDGDLRTSQPLTDPPVERLRQSDVRCGFISEVYDALVDDPRWRLRVEDALINTYLTTVSQDLVAEVAGRGSASGRVWWVNQGKTYREELSGGYVWAPVVTKRGSPVAHHTAVGDLAVGDTIVHYSATTLRALGRVVAAAEVSPRPVELPGEPWGDEGRRADVEYFPLSAPISLAELGDRPHSVGPFDSAGAVKQGYLFELPSEWAAEVRYRFVDRWPSGSPWGTAQYWLFQANPRQWDLAENLQTWKVGEVEDWTLSRHADEVRDGDGVALFASGSDGGILALGRLDGEPYERERPSWRESGARPTERSINVELVRALPNPIARPTLVAHPVLRDLAVLRAPQGTNYRMTDNEWRAVQTLIAGTGDRLEQFMSWALRFRDDPSFRIDEVDYKLTISERLHNAISDMREGTEGWQRNLGRAFAAPNNLTSFRVHQPYVNWATEHADIAIRNVDALWNDGVEIVNRVDEFTSSLPETVPPGSGGRTSLASLLLMAHDAHRFPPYRWTPVETADRLLQHGGQPDTSGPRYKYLLDLLDELVERSQHSEMHVGLSDRLEAQSAFWYVTSGTPLASWDDSTAAAYLAFFDGSVSEAPRDSGLAEMVARFRATGGYTTDDRARAEIERRQLVDALDGGPDNDATFLRLLASPTFGYPGPIAYPITDAMQRLQAVPLAQTVRRIVDHQDDLAQRLREVLDAVPRARGMSMSVAIKVLAAVDPTGWIPYFVSTGRLGTTGLAAALDVVVHEHDHEVDRTIDANDAVRLALEPYFGDDTWGMAQFLRFVRRDLSTDPLALDELGGELLLGGAFIREVVDLLDDKRQVIFYGPPGTGKTYVALELAYHLTDRDAVELVQFHPSYTYEDFIEGFRPTEAGTFLLRPGPLRRFAQAAQQDPDRTYILVIDELNRGNVAKVFGELYFLLEYRDREIRLQYSDDDMVLPRNLRFIGTMNSADRSIGLLDGALRRRFHFVSFAPNDDHLAGLLSKWLAANAPDLAWVDEVVRRANTLLADPHLAIGPSHFLRTDLTEDRVRKIWKHSVLPYLADQFFGREHELAKFELETLRSSAAATHSSDESATTNQPD